ncbi:hypothetical protein GOV09_06875 [Candidatus Woesearchaeota archaeon]|nr:hypothetical protein [Candidatus Woesearchaeota archaeon]
MIQIPDEVNKAILFYPNEQVLACWDKVTNTDKWGENVQNGYLTLTNQRVIFVNITGIFKKTYTASTIIPLNAIDNITPKKSIWGNRITITGKIFLTDEYDNINSMITEQRSIFLQQNSSLIVPPPPPPQHQESKNDEEPASTIKEYKISIIDAEKVLLSSIELLIPNFIDYGTSAEITARMKNDAEHSLENISVDLSDVEQFFDIEGAIKVPILKPGMTLNYTVRIKPKVESGVIPIKIKITGSGATLEKEYTIKVGGTEIY